MLTKDNNIEVVYKLKIIDCLEIQLHIINDFFKVTKIIYCWKKAFTYFVRTIGYLKRKNSISTLIWIEKRS